MVKVKKDSRAFSKCKRKKCKKKILCNLLKGQHFLEHLKCKTSRTTLFKVETSRVRLLKQQKLLELPLKEQTFLGQLHASYTREKKQVWNKSRKTFLSATQTSLPPCVVSSIQVLHVTFSKTHLCCVSLSCQQVLL